MLARTLLAICIAAPVLADIAVPREGPILRHARVDGKQVVAGEQTQPLDGFLLVEREDGTFVWSPDVKSRILGYRRLVVEECRPRLALLARAALQAQDAAGARLLYDRLKRDGFTGKEERRLLKRLQALERKSKVRVRVEKAREIRAEAEKLHNKLPDLLVARAGAADRKTAFALVRAALEAVPNHAAALALLQERVPADSPFKDPREWLEWHVGFERQGYALMPGDDFGLKRAQHYWRPDLWGMRSKEIQILTPIRDLRVVAAIARPADAAITKLRELFHADTPRMKRDRALTLYLYADRTNFTEQAKAGRGSTIPPYYSWPHARWNLKEDVTRLLWEDGSDLARYAYVHEVVRHWLWSRNPNYSSSQLMRSHRDDFGYWVQAGLSGMLAQNAKERRVRLARVATREGLVEWKEFLRMSRGDLHERITETGLKKTGTDFAAQAIATCCYLYEKRRASLRNYSIAQYLGRQAELAPKKALGMSAAELGAAVVRYCKQ